MHPDMVNPKEYLERQFDLYINNVKYSLYDHVIEVEKLFKIKPKNKRKPKNYYFRNGRIHHKHEKGNKSHHHTFKFKPTTITFKEGENNAR